MGDALQPLTIADRTCSSRLILGTGGAPSLAVLEEALVASGQLVQRRGSGTFVAPRVERLEQALSLLRSLDKAPVQVLIDVMLVEVALNDATRMGVQAYLQGNEGSLLATPGQSGQIGAVVPGFNLILGNMVNPKLIINALSQVTDVRVVSAPSVSAFENEEAEIKVVDQVPIVTQQVVGTQTPDAPVVNSVQYTDAGVIMRVTPQIASTGLVNLKISQELSAVAGSSDASGSLTPTLRRRSISTRVAVYDQQTVALGGLISTQASKGLTANKILPILGRHQSRDGNRSELVVFITPHVVRNERDASAVSQELRNKMTMMHGQ